MRFDFLPLPAGNGRQTRAKPVQVATESAGGATAIAGTTVLVVSSRWAHLGGHSGLAPLVGKLSAHLAVDRVVPNAWDRLRVFAARLRKLVMEKILGAGGDRPWSPFYNRTGLLLETAARRILSGKKYDFVLFEALEDHFNLFGAVSGAAGRTKVIAVSHQPPAWWRLYGVDPRVLSRIDTLIVLSRDAQRYMQDVMGHGNVHFVPHGVSVDFFVTAPAKPASGKVDVVFSGQWLRDFGLLRETIRLLAETHPTLTFHLVVPKFARTHEAHYEIATFANVRWYSGLSDAALLALYHHADFMFLPLIDSTANNSVLEAMSTGLPLIVSDVGGVRDYVGEDCAVLISPNTPARAAEMIRWCVDHTSECTEMAARARNKAVSSLSWDHFAEELSSKIHKMPAATHGERA